MALRLLAKYAHAFTVDDNTCLEWLRRDSEKT